MLLELDEPPEPPTPADVATLLEDDDVDAPLDETLVAPPLPDAATEPPWPPLPPDPVAVPAVDEPTTGPVPNEAVRSSLEQAASAEAKPKPMMRLRAIMARILSASGSGRYDQMSARDALTILRQTRYRKEMRSPVPATLLGAATWGAAEYLIHRFAGHEYAKNRNPFAVEHVRHHATTSYFAPTWRKVLAAAAVSGVVAPIASYVFGPRRGLAFTAGLVATYGSYEVLHRRAHTRAPRTRYGRWLRKHHFHHHFHDPSANHGVTTPLGDWLFGTARTVGRVRVPRRQAMPWLLDDRGELRAEHAGDYELIGKA
jgi:hypothetical protein